MTSSKKPDADKIIAHIELIKRQQWLAPYQRGWPDYLFHFTDISNAVKMLQEGMLFSRSELEKRKSPITDIASPEIISSTPSEWKGYVRLYFRPRTPMQYRNEGFRPIRQRELGGAHCPVPIVFIFDAKNILTNKKTKFSDGNLAAGAAVGEDSNFFLSIPFQKVYHDESIGENEKRNIIFHRHAEVIIPDSLDLSNLKFIWCRSQAEFETLVHLLPNSKWMNKIGIGNRAGLFNARWSFVEKVDLSPTIITFTFNPSQTPGPFFAKITVEELETKTHYFWENKEFFAAGTKTFNLSNMTHPEFYSIELSLDNQLAYKNIYIDVSEVF